MDRKRTVEIQPPTISKKQRLDTATDATSFPPESEFDSKVLTLCAEQGLIMNFETLSSIQMVTLLIAILKSNKNLVLDTSTLPDFSIESLMSFSKFIMDHPELQSHLQEAWKLKRFEEIRHLPSLQAPAAQSRDQGGVYPHIQKAWKQTYRTQAHEALYKSISEMWGPDAAPYQNILAIIQSSGYGKTRMLDEHAKHVFTFPFVIRNPSETSHGLAYPDADECVHKFLTTFGNTEKKAMAGYRRFFGDLFTRSLLIIKESNWRSESESLPKWWRSYLAIPSNREDLYLGAVTFGEATMTPSSSSQSALQDLDNELKTVKSAESLIPGCPSSPSQSALQDGGNEPKAVKFAESSILVQEWPMDNQPRRPKDFKPKANHVSTAAEDLLKEIQVPTQEADKVNLVKAVIYFDEAHELSKYKVVPDGRNRLELLQSCLDIFLPYPLMFIFTSTTSSLHHLAPPRSSAHSARRRIGDSIDHAPITELPFDCHHSFPLQPDKHSFEDICTLEFLARFGRPLFWTLLENGGTVEQGLGLAKEKLAPPGFKQVYDSSVSLISGPNYSLTATIDLLLMFNYNPDHQTVQRLQKELVANHMRTCISIPRDGEYIRSCYPSEPFLAEAAMAKLAEELDHPDHILDVVNQHFSHGLLHSGDLGELTTRMLLMGAYMNACKQGSKGKQVIYSEGCKVSDFLQCLLQEADSVLEAKPDNVPDGMMLKDAFQDAVVRFTHFAKFFDDTATSQHAAHAAFFRCMAIICHDSQESVDIIIPVLSTKKGMVCPHVITSILIQVKRRVRSGNARLLAIDQSKLKVFPKNTMCKCGRDILLTLPYISLVLDLGVREQPTYAIPIHYDVGRTGGTAISTLQITPAAQSQVQVSASPARNSPRKSSPRLPTHHRYAIYVRGLTKYRSVTKQNLHKYEQLLRLSNLLGDHPRQDSLHLSMVRALKPFWAGGEAFDWIQNEALTARSAPLEEDTLEVGKYGGEESESEDNSAAS